MTKSHTPEIGHQTVQLVIESEKDYPSAWAAIRALHLSSILRKNCTPKRLRSWHQKYLNQQNPVKIQSLSDQKSIKQLEHDNKEL